MSDARPNLTMAELSRLCWLRDELNRRALLAAQIYFRKHPNSEADSDADLKVYAEHEFSMSLGRNYVRVIASDEGHHYLDSVDLPLPLAGKLWETSIRSWVGKAREIAADSRRRNQLMHLRSAIAEFPDDAREMLDDLAKNRRKS